MPADVIFDVEIRDASNYATFMAEVKPALESAGGRYFGRDGAHRVDAGDWQPRRLVLLEFPSNAAWEGFHHGAPTRR